MGQTHQCCTVEDVADGGLRQTFGGIDKAHSLGLVGNRTTQQHFQATLARQQQVFAPVAIDVASLHIAAHGTAVGQVDLGLQFKGAIATPTPQLQTALELNASLTDKVTVNKVGDFTWDITYNSTLAPPLSLTVSGSGIVSFTGYTITLDMTTAGVTTLLGGAASAEATLEISTTQTTGSYVQTAAQIPCIVYEDIL